MSTKHFVAFDLGIICSRTIFDTLLVEKLELKKLSRFPNAVLSERILIRASHTGQRKQGLLLVAPARTRDPFRHPVPDGSRCTEVVGYVDWPDPPSPRVFAVEQSFLHSGEAQTLRTFVIFDLAKELGRVFLKGVCTRGKWISPHWVDVTDLIPKGTSTHGIETAKNWTNRQSDDRRHLPFRQRKTWTSANP